MGAVYSDAYFSDAYFDNAVFDDECFRGLYQIFWSMVRRVWGSCYLAGILRNCTKFFC